MAERCFTLDFEEIENKGRRYQRDINAMPTIRREGVYSRQKVRIVSRVDRSARMAEKKDGKNGYESKRCLCNPIFRPIGAGWPISSLSRVSPRYTYFISLYKLAANASQKRRISFRLPRIFIQSPDFISL